MTANDITRHFFCEWVNRLPAGNESVQVSREADVIMRGAARLACECADLNKQLDALHKCTLKNWSAEDIQKATAISI